MEHNFIITFFKQTKDPLIGGNLFKKILILHTNCNQGSIIMLIPNTYIIGILTKSI